MATKFDNEDIEDDVAPSEEMVLKQNERAISAKDLLRSFGFTTRQIQDIIDVHGEQLYQAADRARALKGLKLSNDLILSDLLSSSQKTSEMNVQANVQALIQAQVFGDQSAVSSSFQKNGKSGEYSDSTGSCSRRADSSEPTPWDGPNLPALLKEQQYHIFLLFCDEDTERALSFVQFLECIGFQVCIHGQTLAYITNKFKSLEEAIKRSLFTFIFVTKIFCEDGWSRYNQDAALAESIETNGEFVIPVKAEDGCRMPFSLQPLTPLRIAHVSRYLPRYAKKSRSVQSSSSQPNTNPKSRGESSNKIKSTKSNEQLRTSQSESVKSSDRSGSSQSKSSKSSDQQSSSQSTSQKSSVQLGTEKEIDMLKIQISKLVESRTYIKKQREQRDEEEREKWVREDAIRREIEAMEKEIRKKNDAIKQMAAVQQVREKMQNANERLQRALQADSVEKKKFDQRQTEFDLTTNFNTPENDIITSIEMLRSKGFGDIADMLQAQLKPKDAGVHISYHLPSNARVENLGPRVEIYTGPASNIQVGSDNQIIASDRDVPLSDSDPGPDPGPEPTPEPTSDPELDPHPVNISESESSGEINSQQITLVSTEEQITSGSNLQSGSTGTGSFSVNVIEPETGPYLPFTQAQASGESSSLSLIPNVGEFDQTVPKEFGGSPVASEDTPSYAGSSGITSSGSRSTLVTTETHPLAEPEGSESEDEEEPPRYLGATSVHNFESAPEHFDHPPASQHCEQNPPIGDPLALVENPPDYIDDPMSIRSMPHRQRPVGSDASQSNSGENTGTQCSEPLE